MATGIGRTRIGRVSGQDCAKRVRVVTIRSVLTIMCGSAEYTLARPTIVRRDNGRQRGADRVRLSLGNADYHRVPTGEILGLAHGLARSLVARSD